MIKTILVPMDGSDHAAKALDLASDLAGKYGAALVLLHVFRKHRLPEALLHEAEVEHVSDPPAGGTERLAAFPAEIMARNKSAEVPLKTLEFIGRQVLGGPLKAARAKGVKEVRTTVEQGDPAETILACAKREKADMIVMGSRGLSDLKGLLLGSVSHKVSHLATCTCVTVR